MKNKFYVKPYSMKEGGYPVVRLAGECQIAVFLHDTDAITYCKLRNHCLKKYNTDEEAKVDELVDHIVNSKI